ncbi:MAG: PilW family protein [Candidatus Altimarinota bacterium]
MRKNDFKNQQNGLTIVELLVAIGIFTIVGLMAVNIFVNITRIQGRLSLENAIYEDARFMMERISRSIRSNAIDYEEYFNKAIDSNNQFGDLYGCYAAQFYNPGEQIEGQDLDSGGVAAIPGELGAFCSDGELYSGQDCTVYKPSLDINTGFYPYNGKSLAVTPEGENSNAFCPVEQIGVVSCDGTEPTYPQESLYLISPDGKRKTIFGLKTINGPERALSLLELTGQDGNNDGISEKWSGCTGDFCCSEGFDCTLTSPSTTLEDTLAQGPIYEGFIPISPLRTNVKNITFYVLPVEDPRKAFAEEDVIYNPRVIVVLTVTPTLAQLNRYGDPGNVPELTLQTTISSRIQTEVKSYLGNDTYNLDSGVVCPL